MWQSLLHHAVETFWKAHLDRLAEKRFQHKNPTTKPDNHFICIVCNCACGTYVGLLTPENTLMRFIVSTTQCVMVIFCCTILYNVRVLADMVDVFWQGHCMLETRFKTSTAVLLMASHLTLCRLCWSVGLLTA